MSDARHGPRRTAETLAALLVACALENGCAAPSPPAVVSRPEPAASVTLPAAASGSLRRPPRLRGELVVHYPTGRAETDRRRRSRPHSGAMEFVFQVLVGPDGSVQHLSVRRSVAPGSAYEDAAEDAIRRAHFEPGSRDGEPAAMWTLVQVDFPDR